MIESIGDLKNNRRKLVTDTAAAYEPLMRLIRTACERRSQTVTDALRVPYKDLISAGERGVFCCWDGGDARTVVACGVCVGRQGRCRPRADGRGGGGGWQ